jgi:predicted transposase YdaD
MPVVEECYALHEKEEKREEGRKEGREGGREGGLTLGKSASLTPLSPTENVF